jgi:hypothetical protein
MDHDWRTRAVPVEKFRAQANQETTARATKETRELIDQLVQHAITTAEAAEVRERQMLRWTQAGVVLAAVAAVASLVVIVVTVVVGD